MSKTKYGQAVAFNAGGENKDCFALVTGTLPNGNQNLVFLDENGAFQVAINIPYHEGDAGRTWHNAS